MVNVIVASNNKAKIDATRLIFSQYFHDLKISNATVESGVHQQPTNDDVFKGAEQRALALIQTDANADFSVGIEGGIIKYFNRWFQLDCVCIINKTGQVSFGNASSFELPNSIVAELQKGKELSVVVDELLGRNDTREIGIINYLSKGQMDKTKHLAEGVLMALLPLINEQLFKNK
ncbi:MAG: inosine/xanthosine triphosphatase [Candidatus Micrarchaeaceae archaeon]|jgi:inosine/xanthosine triphosphatase